MADDLVGCMNTFLSAWAVPSHGCLIASRYREYERGYDCLVERWDDDLKRPGGLSVPALSTIEKRPPTFLFSGCESDGG